MASPGHSTRRGCRPGSGTRSPDRVLDNHHGIDIEAVTFEVFGLADGEMITIREIAGTTPGPEPVPEDDRLKAVLAQAQKTAIERSPKTSWRRERASAFMPAHTKPA